MLRTFVLSRESDESGVSGTGEVLEGVVFHTGQVVACWKTESSVGHSSIAIYESWEAFHAIHIKSHPTNQTQIRWADEM